MCNAVHRLCTVVQLDCHAQEHAVVYITIFTHDCYRMTGLAGCCLVSLEQLSMVQMFFDAKSSIKFQQNSELSGHGCYTAVG